MGFSSMVRWMLRVVAFVALVSLSLQAACAIGLPTLTSAQHETHGNKACHESAPSRPQAPDSGHICCSGHHSLDVLLSATITPAPLALDGGFLALTSALRSFESYSTDFPVPSSPPNRPFVASYLILTLLQLSHRKYPLSAWMPAVKFSYEPSQIGKDRHETFVFI